MEASESSEHSPAGRRLLHRSLSAQIAWKDHVRSETAVETVAEAFAVVSLPLLEPLQPLEPCGDDEPVLSNLCFVTASEVKPEGFEVLIETPCSQKAVVSTGGGPAVYLAQCIRPMRLCLRPITAMCLVDSDRGETAPAGFEPVERTADAERATIARTLWVSRLVADPRDGSPSAAPLAAMVVLPRHGHGSSVPPGYERLEGVLGGSRAERVLAVCRARPTGLLQTPLKASIVEAVLRHERPTDAAGSSSGESSDDDDTGLGGDDRRGSGGESTARSMDMKELPSALPHFCLPEGARLRTDCPWPTAHAPTRLILSGPTQTGPTHATQTRLPSQPTSVHPALT